MFDGCCEEIVSEETFENLRLKSILIDFNFHEPWAVEIVGKAFIAQKKQKFQVLRPWDLELFQLESQDVDVRRVSRNLIPFVHGMAPEIFLLLFIYHSILLNPVSVYASVLIFAFSYFCTILTFSTHSV